MSCSQCTGKQIVTFKKKLNTVKMSCTASSMNISQTCPGKLRGPMLWNNTACCQPWDHRYFLIFCNFTQRLLSFTQNNFYFFTHKLHCTYLVWYRKCNRGCISATKVLFIVSFSWICFWLFSFPYQKLKTWDKESPKLLLGQCACRRILGKMMARKSLPKSDFEHSYPPC